MGSLGFHRSETPTNYVNIRMDSGADFVIELQPETAPVTVANFQKLVSEKFYDNLTFHRVVYGYLIQGGDPEGTGMGGSAETIYGEFASNGFDNKLQHHRGVISMARTQVYDSASSQFFICIGDCLFLDNDYAAFGTVVAGMEAVDNIGLLPRSGQETFVRKPVMKEVFFVEPD